MKSISSLLLSLGLRPCTWPRHYLFILTIIRLCSSSLPPVTSPAPSPPCHRLPFHVHLCFPTFPPACHCFLDCHRHHQTDFRSDLMTTRWDTKMMHWTCFAFTCTFGILHWVCWEMKLKGNGKTFMNRQMSLFLSASQCAHSFPFTGARWPRRCFDVLSVHQCDGELWTWWLRCVQQTGGFNRMGTRCSKKVQVWLRNEDKVCVEWKNPPPPPPLLPLSDFTQTFDKVSPREPNRLLRPHWLFIALRVPMGCVYVNSVHQVTNGDDFSAGLVWPNDRFTAVLQSTISLFSSTGQTHSIFFFHSFIFSTVCAFIFPAWTSSGLCVLWVKAGMCQLRYRLARELPLTGSSGGRVRV